ncbi:sulfotransferase family protein [Pseudoalteromonas spongiae]|uniref:sulfotransferase family protein n=1 Tax=Pseudoalteromonas spongiae TaxID=298657 RepID=UPI0024B5218E|nr:sulfotransferase family protein [Pseudoalteromonas spongiae]
MILFSLSQLIRPLKRCLISSQKIFVLGLPRTGTTSVCAAALALGFKTTHTVYIQSTLDSAEFVADTPVFNDYEALLQQYPTAKFIYLERDLASWLPSIKVLLTRMADRLLTEHGGFFPSLKRCYGEVFYPLNKQTMLDDAHLTQCYLSHKAKVMDFFQRIDNQHLVVNLSDDNSYQQFCSFLGKQEKGGFEQLNVNGKVTAWKQIKSPLKLDSTRNGKADLK